MKSPFPGMDPYLEASWRDVHATLIVYMRDEIQPQLGGGLRARVEERLVVETPLDGTCPIEERTETFIEVRDRSAGDNVVTVIELISPSNKLRGQAHRQYRRKQRDLYEANVNLVEIDLTRGGRRRFLLPEAQVPPSHRATYQACAFRASGEQPRFELYAMFLRRSLPAIRIPVRRQDADVVLDLQPLLTGAYANGAYDDIDYSRPPVPPLEGDDASWADELLRAGGYRK